jgi:hypothetical protein
MKQYLPNAKNNQVWVQESDIHHPGGPHLIHL